MSDKCLLDVWCALNSSFGGPLLAIVTVGGLLALGRSLLSFPDPDERSTHATDRIKFNRFRRYVFVSGIASLLALLANIGAYIYAFGAIRNGAIVCVSLPISPDSRQALVVFFLIMIVTAATCFGYQIAFTELKKRVPK